MFVEMFRRSLKVNAGKSQGMAQNEEEGLESEVYAEGICLGRLNESRLHKPHNLIRPLYSVLSPSIFGIFFFFFFSRF